MKNTGRITIPGCAVVRPPLSVLRRPQQPLSSACTGQICQHTTCLSKVYIGSEIALYALIALVYKHRKHGFRGSVCIGAGISMTIRASTRAGKECFEMISFFPTTWIKKECWVAQRSPVEACPCVY